MTHAPSPQPVCFGSCSLDPGTRSLRRAGSLVPLGARAFDVLCVLVDNRHRVVGKDELLRAAWPGRVVEENNLQVQISTLRRLLGPGCVATVAGRGYRFTVPVDGDAAPASAPKPSLPAGPPAQSWPTLELHSDERMVVVGGRRVPLRPNTLALLQALIDHVPHPVDKQVLMDRVWPGAVVSENSLQSQIVALRKVLGPGAIVTVPGRGYAINLGPGRQGAAVATAVIGMAGAGGAALIGREQELAELARRLREQPVLTLCGPGGIGKTQLARAAAQAQRALAPPAWRDGVWWVDLVPLQRSDELPQRLPRHLAQALGLTLPARAEPAQSLAAVLAPLHALLVLDNCEHLGQAAPQLLAALREAAPGLRWLATSREPLQLPGEIVMRLPPLALPVATTLAAASQAAAVQLFAERAARASRQFALDEYNLGAAVRICTQLDGLPLAIELAAGRVPLLGVQGVCDKLGQALQLLGGGAADGDPRHHSLRAALDWSYALLPEPEQALYRQLSVFVGGFTPRLVQRMLPAQDEWQLLDMLGALVDKSLLVSAGGEAPRCHLLQTLQAHAAALLEAHGETSAARRSHTRALRELFDTALDERDRATLGDYAFADRLTPEIDNALAALDAAQALGDIDTTFVLADAVAAALFAQGRSDEVLTRLLALLPLAEQAGSANAGSTNAGNALPRARLWHRVGRCGCNGRLPAEQALALLERAALAFEQAGWHRRLHECLWMRAEALFDAGRIDEGEAELVRARALEAPHWHEVYAIRRLRTEGFLLYARGRIDEAATLAIAVAEQAAAAALPRYEVTMRCDLGVYLERTGQLAQALATHADVIERTRTRPADRFVHSDSLRGLAECAAAAGQRRLALQCLHELMPLWRMRGLLLPRGGALALVLARLAEPRAAAQWLGAVDAHLTRLGNHHREQRFSDALQLLHAQHAPGEVRLWCAEGAAMRLDDLQLLVPLCDTVAARRRRPAPTVRRTSSS